VNIQKRIENEGTHICIGFIAARDVCETLDQTDQETAFYSLCGQASVTGRFRLWILFRLERGSAKIINNFRYNRGIVCRCKQSSTLSFKVLLYCFACLQLYIV